MEMRAGAGRVGAYVKRPQSRARPARPRSPRERGSGSAAPRTGRSTGVDCRCTDRGLRGQPGAPPEP